MPESNARSIFRRQRWTLNTAEWTHAELREIIDALETVLGALTDTSLDIIRRYKTDHSLRSRLSQDILAEASKPGSSERLLALNYLCDAGFDLKLLTLNYRSYFGLSVDESRARQYPNLSALRRDVYVKHGVQHEDWSLNSHRTLDAAIAALLIAEAARCAARLHPTHPAPDVHLAQSTTSNGSVSTQDDSYSYVQSSFLTLKDGEVRLLATEHLNLAMHCAPRVLKVPLYLKSAAGRLCKLSGWELTDASKSYRLPMDNEFPAHSIPQQYDLQITPKSFSSALALHTLSAAEMRSRIQQLVERQDVILEDGPVTWFDGGPSEAAPRVFSPEFKDPTLSEPMPLVLPLIAPDGLVRGELEPREGEQVSTYRPSSDFNPEELQLPHDMRLATKQINALVDKVYSATLKVERGVLRSAELKSRIGRLLRDLRAFNPWIKLDISPNGTEGSIYVDLSVADTCKDNEE